MRPGNSPQLACWSILAFGFQCYNHRHHSRWEDLAAHCAMVEGPGLEPRLCDYQSQVLADYTIPPYNGAFKLPTQAPSAGCKFLPLSNLPKGTRIKAHRAYLVNLYTAPSVRLALHSASLNFIVPICIYEINADLRLTNCLIFVHIRPVRRHGLSIE